MAGHQSSHKFTDLAAPDIRGIAVCGLALQPNRLWQLEILYKKQNTSGKRGLRYPSSIWCIFS